MAQPNSIPDLLLKRFHTALTADEQALLDQWLQESPHNRTFFTEINDEEQLRQLILSFRAQEREVSQERVQKRLHHQLFSVQRPIHRVHLIKTAWFRCAAAAVLLLAGTGVYLLLQRKEKPTLANIHSVPVKTDIMPGGNKAVLTLSDGSTIVLDRAAIGPVANQGATNIVKPNDGSLTYTGSKATDGTTAILYNTISTPKGGQYQVTLPDGTKVWLNAASSIRFPTSFGNTRTVQITGELYFEVTHDKSKPFIVQTGETNIQVLGTKFNVNAYTDEPAVKTSLMEGKVAVTRHAEHLTLQPGEQAICATHDPLTINHSPDMEQVMAWKNGLFNFNEVTLRQAMRQIANWYNVDVHYAAGVPDPKFWGKMQRDLTLSQLLELLNTTGVHFTIQEKKDLIVTP